MNNNWIHIHRYDIQDKVSLLEFWNGVHVWVERPHIINRKLLAAETIQEWKMLKHSDSAHICLSNKILEVLETGLFSIEELNILLEDVTSSMVEQEEMSIEEKINGNVFVVTIRKLLPRNLKKFSDVFEVAVLDYILGTASFYPRKNDVLHSPITPAFPYRLKLNGKVIVVEACRSTSEIKSVDLPSEKWLTASVLPKVINWCQSIPKTTILSSLSLVSKEKYNMNYNYLKSKYGKKFVEFWPESSDPLKYVYEDISIAAYLMTLWDEERRVQNLTEKQSFVDFGCGNGLLVNILSSEGHKGVGFDVRKRKIWDSYGPETVLIEKIIEPSAAHLFPSCDWVIGNHSDELTPWIPVIGARSSYNMRVFLLPCCSYTFDGKYEKNYPGSTLYQSYLAFIHDLCEAMGFEVRQDKMRIPSTKRICFVCMSRTYEKDQEEMADIVRNEFIASYSRKVSSSVNLNADAYSQIENELQCRDSGKDSGISFTETTGYLKHALWVPNFKPREQKELVRNCTNFDEKFLEDTVITIANILLKMENYVNIHANTEIIHWNSGGQVSLPELIELLDQNILKKMKNQCGGLQTFLRNHKNVFKIQNCKVQLNVPSRDAVYSIEYCRKRSKHRQKIKSLWRTKKCFFHFHHPQGCPLSVNDCTYSHD